MIRKRTDEDAGFYQDTITSRRELEEVPDTPYKPAELETPVDHLIRHCRKETGREWLRQHNPPDLLTNFYFAAATSSRPSIKRGVVGFVRTAQPVALLAFLDELNHRQYGTALYLPIISKLDQIFPYPLLEMQEAFTWLKERDYGQYADLLSSGVHTPGAIFDDRINRNRKHLLVASGDIRDTFKESNLRIARHILNKFHLAGFSTLFLYSDPTSRELLNKGNLLTGIPVFDLGTF